MAIRFTVEAVDTWQEREPPTPGWIVRAMNLHLARFHFELVPELVTTEGALPGPTLFSELVKALAAQHEYDSAHGRCSRLEGGLTPQQHVDLEEAARHLAVAEERFEQALETYIRRVR